MQKKLYKAREGKMVAGVCAGIGKYFDVDPTLVRLGWVILALAGGAGILAYLLAAIIIPEEPY